MSRFEYYVSDSLNEKVSKKEIDDALDSDDILIGCEFEFICTELKDEDLAKKTNELYDKAVDDHERYISYVREYIIELEDYKRKTDDMIGNLHDLGDEIYNLKKELKEEEAWLEGNKSDRDMYISRIKDPSFNDEQKNNLKNRIKSINDHIKYRIDKIKSLENKIKDLNRKSKELEDNIEHREEEGVHEDLEAPYFDKHSYRYYFDYMTNFLGFDEIELYTEPGRYPSFGPDHYFDNDDDDDFVKLVKSSDIFNIAPFDNYEVGEYGSVRQGINSKVWAVENDSSLGPDGVEVKSPPMSIKEFFKKDYLRKMFQWIEDIGYTNSSCGFHVHMSIDKKSIQSPEIDYLKLILFLDEEWIWKSFPERAYNIYTNRMKDKMKNASIIDKKDVYQFFDKKSLVMGFDMHREKYDGINIIDKEGHVEFRYMGGRDYHKKYKEVNTTIGVYAHTLRMAFDPNYKRKEYILKIQRIFNKMELFYWQIMMEIVHYIMNNTGSNESITQTDYKVLEKYRSTVNKNISNLSKIYKIDQKTNYQISNNHGFIKGVYGECVKEILKLGLSKDALTKLLSGYPSLKFFIKL